MEKITPTAFITSIGEVVWSNIHKPNTKYYSEGMYTLDVVFSKEEIWNIKTMLDSQLDNYLEGIKLSGEIEPGKVNSVNISDTFKATEKAPTKLSISAKQYTKSKNTSKSPIKIFDHNEKLVNSLSSELQKGTRVRLKLYPKTYYSKKSNSIGISLRINEIHIVSKSPQTKHKTKSVSAKVPVDLLAEFERVRGEYYGLNYSNITLTTAVITGIKQTIIKMNDELDKSKG
jgi:hypothetical protein